MEAEHPIENKSIQYYNVEKKVQEATQRDVYLLYILIDSNKNLTLLHNDYVNRNKKL